jgi:hypothetical protein
MIDDNDHYKQCIVSIIVTYHMFSCESSSVCFLFFFVDHNHYVLCLLESHSQVLVLEKFQKYKLDFRSESSILCVAILKNHAQKKKKEESIVNTWLKQNKTARAQKTYLQMIIYCRIIRKNKTKNTHTQKLSS